MNQGYCPKCRVPLHIDGRCPLCSDVSWLDKVLNSLLGEKKPEQEVKPKRKPPVKYKCEGCGREIIPESVPYCYLCSLENVDNSVENVDNILQLNAHIIDTVAWHFSVKGHDIQEPDEKILLTYPRSVEVNLSEFELHLMEAVGVRGMSHCSVIPMEDSFSGYRLTVLYDEFIIAVDHYSDAELSALPFHPFGKDELRDFNLLDYIKWKT